MQTDGRYVLQGCEAVWQAALRTEGPSVLSEHVRR